MSLPHQNKFIAYLKMDNYSDETFYNYERDLRAFENFLNAVGTPFSDITKRTIERYKAYLNSRDRKTAEGGATQKQLKSASINRTLSSLRKYLSYLIDMDYKVPIAPGSIKLLRMEKKHPRVSELVDLIKLIESPMKFEKSKTVALRNRAALEVLFGSGMRIF